MPRKSDKIRQRWSVDKGVAVVTTPGVPKAIRVEVPSTRLDKEIQRVARSKARVAADLARVQAEFDELEKLETDLVALRVTVTAEP